MHEHLKTAVSLSPARKRGYGRLNLKYPLHEPPYFREERGMDKAEPLS